MLAHVPSKYQVGTICSYNSSFFSDPSWPNDLVYNSGGENGIKGMCFLGLNGKYTRYSRASNMRFVYQILKPGTMVDNDGNLYVVYPVTTSYIEPSGKNRCPFCDYVFVKYTSGSGSVTKSTPLVVDIECELRAFYGFGGAGTSDNWGWRSTPYLLTHNNDDFRWLDFFMSFDCARGFVRKE